MELEFAPRLLQPHGLGRMGKSLSSAELLVPPAAGAILRPSGLRRQLALSSAELPAAVPAASAGPSPAVFADESSGISAAAAATTETDPQTIPAEADSEARHADDEANTEANSTAFQAGKPQARVPKLSGRRHAADKSWHEASSTTVQALEPKPSGWNAAHNSRHDETGATAV